MMSSMFDVAYGCFDSWFNGGAKKMTFWILIGLLWGVWWLRVRVGVVDLEEYEIIRC